METPQSIRPRDLGLDAEGWIDVGALDDIADRRGHALVVKGTDVAVLRDGDTVHALGGTCPHRGGPIADGQVIDGKVICPLHLWDFDLATGISPFDPRDCLPRFEARVRDGRVEVDASSVPRGPGRPEVYLGPWIRRGAVDRGMYTVHHLADGLNPSVEAMGSERFEPSLDHGRRYASLDDVVFLPAQLAHLPLLDDEAVDTTVRLGTRAARPLELDIPLLVSHMSFGALSKEAKVALATGAKAAGTAIASGEGGMHPAERAAAGRYIVEMASGYFGWSEEAISVSDAVEIKVGQGAKPGLGGLLPGSKVTAEIASVRGIAEGETSHSPSRFPDINSIGDLRGRLDWIRSVNPGIPIGIKIAAGRVEDDIAAAVDAGADYVIVDGLGGGTGAAPVHVKDHVGIPSWVALHRARSWLDAHGHGDVQVVVTGGFRTPDEMAKAMALGAEAVALATASLMAIGCQQYRACQRGTCPVGIATQAPALRSRLDPEVSAERLTTFLTAAARMMSDFCRITGRRRLIDLDRSDLTALRPEVGTMLDLEVMLSGYASTRLALQRVGAHVLARRRFAVTGRFGLRATPGGFGTPAFGPDDTVEVVRVDVDHLVHEVGGNVTVVPLPGASLASLASVVGVDLAADFSVGEDTPALGDIGAPITIEAAHATALGDWLDLGWRALDRVAAEAEAGGAATLQLWPEHFDAGTNVPIGSAESDRTNLGASTGDASHEEPYLYVGPWGADRPGDASYWNAGFGAVAGRDQISSVEDAVAFFQRGLSYLRAD